MGGNAERIQSSPPSQASFRPSEAEASCPSSEAQPTRVLRESVAPRGVEVLSAPARRARWTGAFALAALLASCSAPWTIRGLHADLAELRERLAPPPAPAGLDAAELVPVRTAVHVHSKYSHDSDGSIRDIAKAARAAGVEVVFLTDHTNREIFEDGPEGWVDGVFFVRGEEISKSGSILAMGTHTSIDKDELSAQECIDAVLEQEGVAAIGHLDCTDPRPLRGYDAVSVRNLHADLKRIPLFQYPGLLLDVLLYGNGRSNELFLHHLIRQRGPELSIWDELLAQRPVSAFAEVDAHQNVKILGLQLDPYRRTLRLLHTFLLVPRDWTRDDLLGALRRGRSYIGFSVIADPTGFSFDGTTADGTFVLAGDELPWSAGLELRIVAPAPAQIVLVKDGRACARRSGRELSFACKEPGVYRAEVRVELAGHTYPWILSNPIYVRAARPEPERELPRPLPDPSLLTQREPARD